VQAAIEIKQIVEIAHFWIMGVILKLRAYHQCQSLGISKYRSNFWQKLAPNRPSESSIMRDAEHCFQFDWT
jgi:hypothetical protein